MGDFNGSNWFRHHATRQPRVLSWTEVELRWPVLKVDLRVRWDRLRDSDLDRIGGLRSGLVACIRDAYGLPEDAVEEAVEAWRRGLKG